VLQALAQGEDVVRRVAQVSIKRGHRFVVASHEQVDLGAAEIIEALLSRCGELPADTRLLGVRMHGKVVDPATMPIVARHHGPNDLRIQGRDQEEIGLDLKLALDIPVGIVPEAQQATSRPECDHCLLVERLERADGEHHFLDEDLTESFRGPEGRRHLRPH
jgi:hypothetical protein